MGLNWMDDDVDCLIVLGVGGKLDSRVDSQGRVASREVLRRQEKGKYKEAV